MPESAADVEPYGGVRQDADVGRLRRGPSSACRRALLDRSRRRRRVLVDGGLEASAVGLAVDDEVVGVVLESVDGALRQQGVVEDGEPLTGVAVERSA